MTEHQRKVWHPIWTLYRRKVAEAHGLRDDLASERLRTLSAEARLAITKRENVRLQRDVWAMERQVRLLMEATPTDLREMDA